jgi:hypothetical protein
VVIRKDRNDGHKAHDGVLVAVRPCFNPVQVHIDTDCEIVVVDVNISHSLFRLGVVYRPLSLDFIKSKVLVDTIKECFNILSNLCLVGDFNFPDID